MLYIILMLIIFVLYILFIYYNYIIHGNTRIVDGVIIRVDKVRRNFVGHTNKFKTIITYSYIVNNKKYISTMIDDFDISNLLYKYIKTESNKKFFKNEYIYYVKNKDIKVRYKINNPQDSKINNFILKEIIYLFALYILLSLIATMILGIYFIYYCK